ncbi:MAG: hypothetical protein AB7O28_07300 [Vicinamibacterales bacterium]
MSVREGDRVRQSSYGDGEVVVVTTQHVTVAFDDGSVRKFVSSIVNLEPSAAPRPAKVTPPRARARAARRVVQAAE